MYHGNTRGTSLVACDTPGTQRQKRTQCICARKTNVAYSTADAYAISYLRTKISVIYSTADAYATDLFIDLRSGSVELNQGI
jgi:hypothetical protein